MHDNVESEIQRLIKNKPYRKEISLLFPTFYKFNTERLFKILNQHNRIDQLSIRSLGAYYKDFKLDIERAARALAKQLRTNRTITTLILDQVEFTTSALAFLIDALKDNDTITELVIRDSTLTDDGLTMLAKKLIDRKGEHSFEELKQKEISGKGAHRKYRSACQLKRLELSNCTGYSYIGLNALMVALLHNEILTTVNFNCFNLSSHLFAIHPQDKDFIKNLRKLLTSKSAITSLHLTGWLQDLAPLLEGLKDSEDFKGNVFKFNHIITTLSHTHKGMNAYHYDSPYPYDKDKDYSLELQTMLDRNRIFTLKGSSQELISINFDNISLPVAQTFSQSTPVEVLNLQKAFGNRYYNDDDDDDDDDDNDHYYRARQEQNKILSAIAEGLYSHPALKEIALPYNCSQKHLKKLLFSLIDVPELTYLDLSGNTLNDSNQRILEEIVDNCKKLDCIKIDEYDSDNALGEKIKGILTERATKNYTIPSDDNDHSNDHDDHDDSYYGDNPPEERVD